MAEVEFKTVVELPKALFDFRWPLQYAKAHLSQAVGAERILTLRI